MEPSTMAKIRLGRGVAMVPVGLGLLIAWGCADDGLPKRYPVRGEVTYNGTPLSHGNIHFLPRGGNGRAASGTIRDGSYDLTTLTPRDGAIPGAYRVTVTAVERTDESTKILARTPGAPAGYDAPYFGPPSGPQLARANKIAKRLVPDKYNNRIDFPLAD
jgi:hypothetical protein